MISLLIQVEKPDFRDAMRRARRAVTQDFDPPLTRTEIFAAYRMARSPGGHIFLRCTFAVDVRVHLEE